MMKPIKYIYLLLSAALCGCTDAADQPQEPASGDIYITASLDAPESRVAYDFTFGSGVDASGNIRATWQIGDIIKVYDIDANGAYTHPYADYAAYEANFPYPMAPSDDLYYRFECVGGHGTSQGIFKYVGLAHAVVVEENGVRNVNVDIKYGHKIKDWNKFQGLVIYGNPLRRTMMRTQVAKNDLSHLRFGERMTGSMCSHHFQWWYDDPERPNTGPGVERLVLKNVGSLVFRVIIGGVDTDIYGGSKLTIKIPGVTSGFSGIYQIRNEPLELTLGNPEDHQLGSAPWYRANNSDDDFCAYVVGWPGIMLANASCSVTLKEYLSGNTYTWELSSPHQIMFEAGPYYTIDLRNRNYTKTE